MPKPLDFHVHGMFKLMCHGRKMDEGGEALSSQLRGTKWEHSSMPFFKNA